MNIWFTRGLSVTADAISTARFDPSLMGATFMASHTDSNAIVQLAADTFIVEPKMSGAAYAAWVLEQARACKVDLIVVQRHPDAIWEMRDAFTDAGIRLLIAARPEVRKLLDDKAAFQTDLAAPELVMAGVAGHAFATFEDVEGFENALTFVKADPATRHGLCLKPVHGIFGAGFRRLDTDGQDLQRMLSSDPEDLHRMPLAGFRSMLASAGGCPKMMLMPYLPGVERSVDFVARDGEVVMAVARRKVGKDRVMETVGASIETARILARRYGLNGICNLQTRECDGREVVLEINPRMAGGMSQTFPVGVNLSGVSLACALGRPLNVPDFRSDVVSMPVKVDLMVDPRVRVIGMAPVSEQGATHIPNSAILN